MTTPITEQQRRDIREYAERVASQAPALRPDQEARIYMLLSPSRRRS